MDKFSMLFSRVGEGVKNAIVSIFTGSILSILIIFLLYYKKLVEIFDSNLSSFLVLAFLYFAVPCIVPYFMAGIIVELSKVSTSGVITLAILALMYHYYISISYGFADPFDILAAQKFILPFARYLTVFIIFLFVSLYQRGKTSQQFNG
jgi:hypothetical protein